MEQHDIEIAKKIQEMLLTTLQTSAESKYDNKSSVIYIDALNDIISRYIDRNLEETDALLLGNMLATASIVDQLVLLNSSLKLLIQLQMQNSSALVKAPFGMILK